MKNYVRLNMSSADFLVQGLIKAFELIFISTLH
jgi:hypothetical protein